MPLKRRPQSAAGDGAALQRIEACADRKAGTLFVESGNLWVLHTLQIGQKEKEIMMRNYLMAATSGDMSPQELRQAIQTSRTPEMRNRRGIVILSLVGTAAMAVVSLLQTGIVKHLPDPPTKKPHFDSDKVNSSKEAYSYGMPDGPLTIAAHALNLALAAAGPPTRWKTRPWLPLLAAGLTIPQALIAGKYLFHQMPKVEKAWCPYCIADALTLFATVALTIPEGVKAVRARLHGR